MSVSFSDSLKNSQENTTATTSIEETLVEETPTVMAYSLRSVAALSDSDGWTAIEDKGYRFYNGEYGDDNYSNVDEQKNITLDSSQFNITQEQNSQYIPFKMPRHYDGFDLKDTKLSVYYVNTNKDFHADTPVDVYYNDEYIKFAWLVSEFATQVAGVLQFEIHAEGTNSKGEPYTWKSKSIDKLNVIQSLESVAVGEIGLSEEEIESWYNKIQLESQVAQAAAVTAQNAANEASRLVGELQDGITQEVETAVNNTVGTVVEEQITEKLGNYYTKVETYNREEVDTAIAAVKPDGYATIEYVDEQIQSIDVTEQLDDYALKTDVSAMIAANPQDFATKQEVTDAIAAEDITTKLGNYYTKEETYNKSEVDEKVSNVTVDLTGYATETYVDNKVSPLSSSISTNTENISSLSTTVGNLQTTVGSIDTSPRLTYDVAYNDTEDENVGENVFVLYEITGEGTEDEVKTTKQKFTIVGGGGGSATSSTLKIGYVTTSPLVVTADDKAIIKYTFSGTDSSGDAVPEGTATWKVAGRMVATNTALNGENSFDITDYLSIGTQKVNLSITDDAGSLVSKTWTVQKIDVRLESTFNYKITYPIGKVTFDYTPYGAISKVVHFILDGKEIGTVTTTASGIPMAYEIPVQEHGSHLLEVYMTADVNGNTIETNHIIKDIIWYDATSTVSVIGTTYQTFTARQYDATNIEYTVYDPTTETPTVTIAVDGNIVSTQTLSAVTNVYSYKTDVIGEHIITITCGETVKTLVATIEELGIEISPTSGWAFDFNPTGKSNNDTNRVWTDGSVSMAVSDNFDWVNGGYQIDENGDTYFCIKAGTSATIDYKLFADDAKKNGKELKLVFKTTNVANSDATFLSCMDNTTDTDHIGIQMNVHEAYVYGQGGTLELPYSEEDVIEFEVNISKDTEAIPMVMGYEDGVSTRPMVYDDSFNFTQNTPKIISLGSEYCDLHIYRFKVYNTSLTDKGILNNFIADARNAEEMINRYDRNQIYDENSQLDPDVLAEKCPQLRIIKIEAPYFTNNKSDKVPNTTIEYIYKGGDPILDNWTAYDCLHSGQGTSSNNYGAAGRNLDLIIKSNDDFGNNPYIILGDGSQVSKVSLTRNSVPVNYFNVKVNIASSNNLTNPLLAKKYNEFNPYNRALVREDETEIPKIKDTMEFYNCVVFIKETNEDLSTHREFADNNWHFYAIGNIGDSKKTDKTRLTDPNDPYECCVEIMDVELPLSDFPKDTMMNAMGYKVDETTQEKIYTWAKDENLGILYELVDSEYVLTEDTTVDLTKTYYVDILEHDDFSEDYTYGWRYISDDENAEVVNYCHQKWIEAYRFITDSTDEEFKANLGNYFVLDSVLYYYLFTTRYCQVDNISKNSFWHYGKTGEVDSDGNPIRKWSLDWAYDMDTSLGLNNYGKQVYRYGLEDTDRDENGEEVFREMDSTFFCRLRDLFPNELKAMYNTLESSNAWHAESFINQGDEWQSQFPEELWRIDIERKYLRTYNSSFINGKGDSQFLVNMANGKMKYHRRQWERNQEKYMASKYQSSVAANDNIVLRCTVPTGDLVVPTNYKLKLTPYAYMYLNVKYGTIDSPIQLRAEPNKEYEIPYTGDATDIVDIYSASFIKSLGDLSSCYPATVDTSKASKLKELIIGNETDGYDNPSFTTLTLGANPLLEKINVENVSGLTQSLNISLLNNLKELYAHGTNANGVTFADGGNIEIAELPAITTMTMKNLMYLTNLDVVSFDKLTTLTVENCSTVDLLEIVNSAPNLNRIRITNINWVLEDTSLLERLYKMSGIDKSGYNADQSVLTGQVHVPVIRQQQLYNYQQAWSDLEIVADTIIEQFAVTFVNSDGSILDVQYIDKGEYAVDPTTRENNPIATPTKESTISTDYTFSGWDTDISALQIFTTRTITALYSESVRSYKIKYVSKGVTVQESTGDYGTNVPYSSDIPTYTLEEGGYKYYLFNRWDKSGFLDGDFDVNGVKTVNAIFDEFTYSEGVFSGKELKDLTPIQIYALTKLTEPIDKEISDFGLVVETGDDYSFTMGYDVDYDDIDSVEVFSEKRTFTGSTDDYYDTGITLFNEDKDFVLALDYKMSSENTSGATLMQCFQTAGTNGFKLNYSSYPQFVWGSSTITPAPIDSREMLVIRHKKGDNNLYVYVSNMSSTDVQMYTIEKSVTTLSETATLIFGAAKQDSGRITNYGIGDINWCKIWYQDLGDDVCKKLAGWIHEKITLETSGFYRYQLYDNTSKESMMSLLATHLLSVKKQWNSTSSNAGGWASSQLNSFLNNRFYNAIPYQIKALIKKVSVASVAGNNSTDITSSGCYVTIPALYDVNDSPSNDVYKSEVYDTNGTIDFMTGEDVDGDGVSDRARTFDGESKSVAYWLRSPAIGTWSNGYVWRVNENGNTEQITQPNSSLGVLIEISF